GAGVLLVAAIAAGALVLARSGTAALASVPPGVVIVDGGSGHPVAQVPWSGIRLPALGFTGDGSFWVWTLDGNAMVRIDPRDGHVLGRISSPMGVDTNGALVDGRNLWFSGRRLVRMDIASGSEADRYALTDDPQNDGLDEIA